MFKKVLLWSLAGIAVLCAAGGIYLYSAVNRDIDEHFAGTCTDLELPGSGEDMQVDYERGYVYLSVFDRMATAKGETPAESGRIMRVDLNAPVLAAEDALVNAPDYIRPHGISIFIDPEGQRHLFMINHPADRDSGAELIERFTEKSPGVYQYAETFSSPLITRANDLVATGPRQFYVAQDVAQGSGQKFTSLVYFDGDKYTAVAEDIESGGGINVSADNSLLYIAETGAKMIRIVRRNPADGSVETVRRLQLDSSPDNINVAEDGRLIVGAHSNLIALVMHFIIGSDAPTQVLRINALATPPVIEEIYLNKGSQLTSGSGAVSVGDRLLIGSITDKKILVCKFDEQGAANSGA
jgi:arylesterase/paraoxonase